MTRPKTWPRFEIRPKRGGLCVIDTWTEREIVATFGGSLRDRRDTVRRSKRWAEYRAMRRVARLRRAILAAGGFTRARADRLARHLDAVGVGRWDTFL